MKGQPYEAVVLGASAGGVEALLYLFAALDRGGCRLPLIAVQHLPEKAQSQLVEIFSARLKRPVKEAEDKEPVEPGTLYIAAPGYHLSIESDRSFSLSGEAPVNFSRPSIDLLFESAAEVYGPALIGVLLTGANEDGAAGIERIARHGGLTLVQDPAEAAVACMPLAALQRFTPDHVLRLRDMVELILRLEEVRC